MYKFLMVWVLLVPSAFAQESPIALDMHAEAMKHRKQYNLKPQVLDEECCQIAQKWAEQMASQHSMYHGGGENIIAVGYTTPASALRGWMGSSGHRYWVLSSVDKCGWGAAQSSTGRWYWAGAFRSSKPVVRKAATTTYYTPRRRFRIFRR
jgi:uncharacterized protein YkwD|tara:strand:+ start:1710 stop:2162 length:453 start_codon:yes stop_codon:yes gene_type:complete